MRLGLILGYETVTCNGLKGKEIKEDTIYVVSTDLNLANSTIIKIIHARWDIENNGFNE